MSARSADNQRHRVRAGELIRVRRIDLIAQRTITEVPRIQRDIPGRLVGKLHRQRRNTRRWAVDEQCIWRRNGRAFDNDLPTRNRRTARSCHGQEHVVGSHRRERMRRVALGAGRTVAEVPQPACDIPRRLVGKLHRQRRLSTGDALRETGDRRSRGTHVDLAGDVRRAARSRHAQRDRIESGAGVRVGRICLIAGAAIAKIP